jgi:hypothetical protein
VRKGSGVHGAMARAGLGFRWTIGNVTDAGFEALRLSIWGAWRLFGAGALYAVCVNGLDVDAARERTGGVPNAVTWRASGGMPASLAAYVDGGMADGVAWKLAPLRLFPDRYEVSLDNDCILWDVPAAVRDWLADDAPRCLIAADVVRAHGAFADMTRPEPRNTGIRGLPPGYDLERALATVLAQRPIHLAGETDEQGLQIVALDLGRPAHVVSTADVAICSPFWPRQPTLGRCGAHFVGLNSRAIPWDYFGTPAVDCIADNWRRHRAELYARVGLPLSDALVNEARVGS